MARTREELEYLIEKRGLASTDSLKVRPLTMREINGMHEHVYAWHEQNNLKNVNAAIDEPRIKAENKKKAEEVKAQRQHSNATTEDEYNAALEEVKKFVVRYPQFRNDYMPNREALDGWLKAHNLSWDLANIVAAFEDLGREGKLLLNPAAVGVIRIKTSNGQTLDICKEDLPVWQRRNGTYRDTGKTVPIPVEILPFEQTTGAELMRSPQRNRLLSAYTPTVARDLELKKMSADEYNKQNPLPMSDAEIKFVEEKVKRALKTFTSFHPEYVRTPENRDHLLAYLEKRKLPTTLQNLERAYAELVRDGYLELNDAVSSGQVAKMVDYAADRKRAQNLLDESGESASRMKTQAEINKMTSAEYERWLQDSANRKAADALAARV